MKPELPHVIVFGSRTFRDYTLLCAKLDLYTADLGKIIVISGAHPAGADRLAETWAFERKYTLKRFYADWEEHGRAAGPIRNEEMAEFAAGLESYAVGFWDGKTSGTRDMINRCRKYKILLKVVRF